MFSCPFTLTPEGLMLRCAAQAPVIFGIESAATLQTDAPTMGKGTNVLTEEIPNGSPERFI